MDFELYSYRFAEEIIDHPKFRPALGEISSVIKSCPLFFFPNKSSNNSRLDVVQQLFNTYFDRRFACDLNWEYHPEATKISGSNLAADYKKDFNGLRIQSEVQFGNMARWYSDIFKFQTAYSQDLIDLALSIVPMSSIANRMDSNIANFERCKRELPSAKLSITLPILLIGIYEGASTEKVDVSRSAFPIASVTGKGKTDNRYRIINSYITGSPITTVAETSPIGSKVSQKDSSEEEL